MSYPVRDDDRLLLNAREAAARLAICPKTLWLHSAPRGDLQTVRIGRRTLYDVADIRRWIDRHKAAPSDTASLN